MAIQSLNPYLHFDGAAAEAIAFYETALGAKAEQVMRWSEIPGEDIPAEHRNRIMHSCVRLGGASVMIADNQPGQRAPSDSNVHVCLHFDDVEDMQRRFDALAQGGKVTMPLDDTFWGAKFGMLTDRFGVHWMFNCDKKS